MARAIHPMPPTVHGFVPISVIDPEPFRYVYEAEKGGRKYIIKRVLPRHYNNLLKSEVDILNRISEHCAAFFACVGPSFRFGQHMYLVIDQGGPDFVTLDRYVQRPQFKFNPEEPRTRLLMKNLVDALILLHTAGVVHRNISPQTILVHPTAANVAVKYVDFGHACSIDDEKCLMAPPQVNPAYTAPEAHAVGGTLRKKLARWTTFDIAKTSDVWSLGAVFYFLASKGKTPWEALPPAARIQEALRARKNPPLKRVTAEGRLVPYWQLIVSMLAVDYYTRETLTHALAAISLYGLSRARKARLSPEVRRMVDEYTKLATPARPAFAVSPQREAFKAATVEAGRARRKLRKSFIGKRKRSPRGKLASVKRLHKAAREYAWPEEKYESPDARYALPSPAKVEKRSALFGAAPPTQLHRAESYDIGLLYWYLRLKEKHRGDPVHLVLAVPGPADQVFDIILQIPALDLLYGVRINAHTRDFANLSYDVSRAVLQSIRDGFDNPAVEWVVFALGFSYDFLPKPTGHANFIIVNKRAREIEHYDPWGLGNYAPAAERALVQFFRDNLARHAHGYTLAMSHHICPRKSMQVIETYEKVKGDYGGFCAVWGLWTIALRLKHLRDDKETVIRKGILALASKEPEFTNFIAKFAQGIEREYARFDRATGLDIAPEQRDLTLSQRTKLLDFVRRYLRAGNTFPARPRVSPAYRFRGGLWG